MFFSGHLVSLSLSIRGDQGKVGKIGARELFCLELLVEIPQHRQEEKQCDIPHEQHLVVSWS
jgi:hypothetical protein